MPTYDYVCEACGHKFEQFQAMTDPMLKKCPKCKKAKLRRLFGTGAAIMFKGSGFYQTDYRSESYKKAASADAAASSESKSSTSDSKSSGSSESKGSSSDSGKSSGKSKSTEK